MYRCPAYSGASAYRGGINGCGAGCTGICHRLRHTSAIGFSPREHAMRHLRLRHLRDLQSLASLLAQPALAAWQWHHGFSMVLFTLMLVLAVGVSVIHHNHAHLPMWRARGTNRITDLWMTLVQGH